MRQYIATAAHTDAGVITEISTLTGLATMLQVATPATGGIKVLGWGISFDGIVSTDAPGLCYLLDGDVGMTNGTTLAWGANGTGMDGFNAWGKAATSACTGMVSDGAVTEGTITQCDIFDMAQVHPQTGYSVWFPSDARPEVALSRFLRIRVNFAVAVNCLPWLVWAE